MPVHETVPPLIDVRRMAWPLILTFIALMALLAILVVGQNPSGRGGGGADSVRGPATGSAVIGVASTLS